jgi:hypothetical protein
MIENARFAAHGEPQIWYNIVALSRKEGCYAIDR